MKQKALRFGIGFRVAIGNEHSQAAEMVIPPGESEGGSDNSHRGADQWLFIVEGEGQAIVNGHSCGLKAGTLMLIERGDVHEIRATGKEPLRTLNFYVPPAFKTDGEALPPGRP
jgi:mannose-6-phosphate isomerase-like protein (cupin superfamily)